jgi:hypothetical protein
LFFSNDLISVKNDDFPKIIKSFYDMVFELLNDF